MLDALGPHGLPDFTLRLNQVVDYHSWIVDGVSCRFENNRQIADAITAAGEPTSRAYVSLLRGGQQSNPSARLINALCKVFDVPAGYWFDREIADHVLEALLVGRGASSLTGSRTLGSNTRSIATSAPVMLSQAIDIDPAAANHP